MSTSLTIKMTGALKQLKSLSRFKRRVFARLTGQQGNLVDDAREVVQEVVYSHPENPRYPRSGNTLAATDVQTQSEGDFVITSIFLNPSMANNSFTYNEAAPTGLRSFADGNFDYYPSYIRRGVIFKRKTTPRDFVAGWGVKMIPVYKRLVVGAIMDFK